MRTPLYLTTHHNMTQHNTQHNTTRHNTTQHNTTQHTAQHSNTLAHSFHYVEQQREKLVNSVDFRELELGECLGGGASAKVYKAKWREDIVAVKQIMIDDPLTTPQSAAAAFQRETVLLGYVYMRKRGGGNESASCGKVARDRER